MKYTIILLLFFISCELKVKQFPEPENLISKEKMVLVIEDLMLMEDYVQNRYPQFEKFTKDIEKSGDEILLKHKISFKQFEKSFDYYASHQDQMKEIYNEVLDNLNKKLNKLQVE